MKTGPRLSDCLSRERFAIVSFGAAFSLAISLVSQLEGAAPALGLLGHWRFEQGQGDVAEDGSGNRNTGELQGAEWAQGEFGTALHFTGKDSCAIVPQLRGLDGSNELTVEAWVLWEAGGRYLQSLDLSKAQALGFWVHGDGKGEAFKLQLRDKSGGWLDMVTHVDFVGWRYQQFDFSGPGKLDRANVAYLLIYYNSIPSKETVTCYVDDVRALPAIAGLRNPVLTIGGKRLAFPAELSTGDRLVFDGVKCRLHRRTAAELEWIQPQGGPVTLEPGRNRVVLSLGSDLLPQFRIAASLVKHYGP